MDFFDENGDCVLFAYPFFRTQTQLLDQQRQVDTKLLVCLNLAARRRMAEALFSPG